MNREELEDREVSIHRAVRHTCPITDLMSFHRLSVLKEGGAERMGDRDLGNYIQSWYNYT